MFKIYNGRQCFWQWDLNQKLLVDRHCQIHFCNGTDTQTLVVNTYENEQGQIVADVPNSLLQEANPIRVYGYFQTKDDSHTRVSALFQVRGRNRPANYVYTQTQLMSWEALSDEVKQFIAEFTQKAEAGAFDGDAPVRGVDYWTPEDIAEMKAYVDEAILGGAW